MSVATEVVKNYNQAYLLGLEHALDLVLLFQKYDKDVAKELERFIEDKKASEV